MNGIRDPRPIAKPPERLEDPRAPENADVTELRRRVVWMGNLTPGDATPWFVADDFPKKRNAVAVPLHIIGAPPTMRPYHYTEGLDTVNDEMGYGERIEDPFYRSTEEHLGDVVRTSQRTKSGRQQLRADTPKK